MPNRLRHLVAAIATAAVVVACGQETAAPTDEASSFDADGAWFVTSYRVGDVEVTQGQNAMTVLDLNTETMALEGAAGCGIFYGSFTFGAAADPAFAGFTIPGRTESSCGDDARAEQELVIAALEGTTSFAEVGDSLELIGDDTSATLTAAS